MTKSGYGKKLLAVSAGVIMLGSIAATGFVGTDLFKASAEGDADYGRLSLEEVDALNTDGYKIEKKSGTYINAEETSYRVPDIAIDDFARITVAAGEGISYDYIFTINNAPEIGWKGSMLLNWATPVQFNITSPNGNSFQNTATLNMNYRYKSNTKGDIIGDQITAYKSKNYADTDATPNFGGIYLDNITGYGECVLNVAVCDSSLGNANGCLLRVLIRSVEVQDNEFAYTSATKDKNNLEHVMWLNYGEHDVLGVSTADDTWTQAEQFMGASGFFFKDIYYLENYDLAAATAAPTDAELEGRDLYTLMTGANNVEDGLLMQTEVRADHIEFKKFARGGVDATAEMSSPVNFTAGDAFYIKQGAKLLGHDANSNWAAASEGGAKNVLSRNQIFVFDGENWSSDQFAVTLNIDTNKAMIEEEATTTITPSFDEGKFAPAEKTVTWASDNEAVATVSQEGVITGVAKGTATITASLANGSYKTVAVTVVGATDIDDIKVARRNETLYTAGDKTTAQIEVTITGGSKAPKNVTYTTSDATIATVSDSGLITAVGEGTAKITVTAADGTHKAEVTVKVYKAAEETPGGNTGDNNDDNNGGNTGDNTDDKKPSGGCGSVVYGGIAGLGAVVLVAGVALTLRKKHE